MAPGFCFRGMSGGGGECTPWPTIVCFCLWVLAVICELWWIHHHSSTVICHVAISNMAPASCMRKGGGGNSCSSPGCYLSPLTIIHIIHHCCVSSLFSHGCHVACLLCKKRNRGQESLTCIDVDSDDNMCCHHLDDVAHLLMCHVIFCCCCCAVH